MKRRAVFLGLAICLCASFAAPLSAADCGMLQRQLGMLCGPMGMTDQACGDFLAEVPAICGTFNGQNCRDVCGQILALLPPCNGDPNSPCAQAREKVRMTCTMWCEQPPDPPDPPAGCREECSLKAQRAFNQAFEACARNCTGADGQIREGCKIECERQARVAAEHALQECLATCEPEPPDCFQACLQSKAVELRACETEACKKLIVDACRAECGIPPEPTCEERCQAGADEVAREVCWICVELCTDVGPRGDGACEGTPCGLLAAAAKAKYVASCPAWCAGNGEIAGRCSTSCVQMLPSLVKRKLTEDGCDALSGLTETGAAALIESLLLACVGECENPPDPPTCDERCAAAAAEIEAAVIAACAAPNAAGVVACTCNALAAKVKGEFLAACTAQCGATPEMKPCEFQCLHMVPDFVRRSISEGKDCTGLDAAVAAFLTDCAANCENPPEPPACQERCDTLWREAFAKCKEQGGADRDCTAFAEQTVAECRANCEGNPPTCPQECAARAREAMAQCMQGCNTAGGCGPVHGAGQPGPRRLLEEPVQRRTARPRDVRGTVRGRGCAVHRGVCQEV